jgi:hypothetical protein
VRPARIRARPRARPHSHFDEEEGGPKLDPGERAIAGEDGWLGRPAPNYRAPFGKKRWRQGVEKKRNATATSRRPPAGH